jgi:hypothetical protein
MDEDVRFTARMNVDYYAARRDIAVEEIGVAPCVVLSWGPTTVEELAESIGAEPAEHWHWLARYPLYTGEIQGRRVSFVQAGIGAPATVAAMESLIACGARLFLGLGWAGSLQPSAPVGTFLIPTRCIREEGTSLHYLDASATVTPASLDHRRPVPGTQQQDRGVPAAGRPGRGHGDLGHVRPGAISERTRVQPAGRQRRGMAGVETGVPHPGAKGRHPACPAGHIAGA